MVALGYDWGGASISSIPDPAMGVSARDSAARRGRFTAQDPSDSKMLFFSAISRLATLATKMRATQLMRLSTERLRVWSDDFIGDAYAGPEAKICPSGN